MIIYYEPINKQIRAIFTGDTNSTVWSDMGYIKAAVPAELENLTSMDKAVVLDGDTIISFVDWPRPVLTADKMTIEPTGFDIATITATGVKDGEDVEFRIGHDTPAVVVAAGGQAQIPFTSEVEGQYTISCFSPTYGKSFITIEVKNA